MYDWWYLSEFFDKDDSISLPLKILESCASYLFPTIQRLELVGADCSSTEFLKVHPSI